ncbi:MAG TPA: TetR family transcriptional regulator, partial [Burkholderiaceae bacterium]|nr:TetR family transcriptional regulator [Burkholderiaceae bacterium]
MPRVSRAEAQRHRQQIEEASARLFRERGLSVSVADLMSEVGLTHGGFYGHFDSKDALAAIAMARAFEEAAARWRKRLADAAGRAALLNAYLHPDNRNVPARGC